MEVQRKFVPIVIVHGGTWASSRASNVQRGQRRRRVAEEAVREAYTLLMNGGSCVDAVDEAVSYMEDCPLFRVGAHNASPNAAGEVETDAIITEGRRLSCGAVFAVQNVANPVKAARAVMEKTQHIMFSGRPASELAHSYGYNCSSVVSDAATMANNAMDLETLEWKKQQQQPCQGSGLDGSAGGSAALDRRRSSLRVARNSTGTSVGAIAIDAYGRVACASSCGGAPGGLPGRVNEGAIIGLGAYAMHRVGGAVACGRNGDVLAKTTMAYAVCRHMQDGMTPQEAARAALSEAAACCAGAEGSCARLGVIALSKSGEFGVCFTAGQMPWAAMTSGQVMSGLGSECDLTDAFCLGPEPLLSTQPSSDDVLVPLRQPVVLVHGGAGSWDVVRGFELDVTSYYDGVKAAALAGYAIARSGGSALEAVVAAVRRLEDDTTFNAGRGSRYTKRKTIEMDAMVMDGRRGGRAAGVATVSNVRNPVLLAKAVLDVMGNESCRHVMPTLLVDAGAVAFAKSAGLELAEDSYFETPTSDLIYARDCRKAASSSGHAARRGSMSERKRRTRPQANEQHQQSAVQVQRRRSFKQTPICAPTLSIARSARESTAPYDVAARSSHHTHAAATLHHVPAPNQDLAAELLTPVLQSCDTVGAVAMDAYGNVACATSTGGKNFKISGRVGDSPIAGCGGYADNSIGAISTTGSGEFIAQSMLARAIMDKVKNGVPIREAAVDTIRESTQRLGHFSVGVIALDCDGTPAVAFNTQGMSWAMAKDSRVTCGLHQDDHYESNTEAIF